MLFSKKNKQLLLLISSFLIVGFAQPDLSPLSCILASSVGYALFWKGMLFSTSKKGRFFLASLWFALISAFHLNWFMADRYVGLYIYPFIFLLCFWLGAQFGVISLLISDPKKMTIFSLLALSGGWTVFEWARLYLFSGFSWDPVGLALTGTLTGMQMASAIGVYGLSFWIFFTNLLALRFISQLSWRTFHLWAAVTCTPYLFDVAHLCVHSHLMEQEKRPPLSALLVQTSLLPEQKVSINGSCPLSPAAQWGHIMNLLSPYLETPHDLIVLPEGVVPYGTDFPLYHQKIVYQTFKAYFENMDFMPATSGNMLSNRFWAQTLANAMNADVVMGLEDVEHNKTYNAAFLFRPFSSQVNRYEKRILVPMGEYIPFSWCKKILSKYGIVDSYTPGKDAKVFQTAKAAAGISICYEETFGNLMLSNRRAGAEMLINITNDVWYPLSRLPIVHCVHGRLRSVEAGIPMLRACNTGVTCGIDALGRVVGQLPFECKRSASKAGVLSLTLPLYNYRTFYTIFGDSLVISISSFLFVSFCIFLFNKRKSFILKYLNIYLLRKN